jgi:cellulose synthase/poly-beta-1,6-N-acetylglucosamine synthase-like glycosyltransferase
MRTLGWTLLLLPVATLVYAYFLYPLLLRLIVAVRRTPPVTGDPREWPLITLTIPAYNEESSIGATLESLLAIEYPAHRRQILVVSDASTDRTDEVVRSYASRGVELLRTPTRGGKTAAENAAAPLLRGEIIVNTDATIRILPDALKALIRVFQDPTVGVASGRDRSVGNLDLEANRGESGYVGYEMWVRSLETRVGSIVGASGCFYAIRHSIHDTLFPAALSRDFASTLIARRHGYRSVSVDDAVCLVPRATSLRAEFRRKVRTMARGLETLWHERALMNPFRFGSFGWMLLSHKLIRWLVFLLAPLGALGLVLLAGTSDLGLALLALFGAFTLLGLLGIYWPGKDRPYAPIALAGFGLVSFVAGFLAWTKALRGELNPIWEPTRRPGPASSDQAADDGGKSRAQQRL